MPTTVSAASSKAMKKFMQDPVKNSELIGRGFGAGTGEVAWVAAVTALTPNKASVAKGIKSAGNALSKASTLFAAEGKVAASVEALSVVAKVDDVLPTAASLGMPKRDQSMWQNIVSTVERSVKEKTGVDVDLQLSFRPRNVYSAEIKDGAGKNLFMKSKAGTDLDVVLGMDPSGLGKVVVYNPKLPANISKLSPEMRAALKERAETMSATYKDWYNPKSVLGKAQGKKGVTLTNTIKDGDIVTTKISMKLQGVTKNGTTSVRYRELTVDGKKIVTAKKPKWVVSDYDGNAILQVGNKNLPASVRGLIETEVMRLQREHGTQMATSFHGFTENGFDLPAKYYRFTFKFLLEGMNEKQRTQYLLKYVKKYADADGKDFLSLLDNYKEGEYVIRVTRDAATVGHGL